MLLKLSEITSKGQTTIPAEIRKALDLEVIVDTVGDSVIIKKLKPASVTYVDYYCSTYSKKLNKRVDIKKLTEEQYERNILH